MKITAEDRFYVVTDPNKHSIIEDILFGCNFKGLENQIIGADRGGYRMTDKGMTIHTNEITAREDAEARLAARD